MSEPKNLGNPKYNGMLKAFDNIGKDAFYMSHYDLNVNCPEYTVDDWRDFLRLPLVADYIADEIYALCDVEVKKLMKNVGSSKGQVGAAQLLTALHKIQGTESNKEGPVFIYSYVPLNKEEEQALNVVLLDSDPFLTEEK